MAYENEEKKLHDALVSCKVPDIKAAVEAADAAGMAANAIIEVLGNSMSEVGVLFERGKLFLPHVLSAANGMKLAMEILGPTLFVLPPPFLSMMVSVVSASFQMFVLPSLI